MKTGRWLLPLLSLAAVVVFTWWDVARVQAGPGPLHPAHAMAGALDGGSNCAGCHDRGAVSATACIGCHDAIGAQLQTGRGVHGTLPATEARACARCHSEHHGTERQLVPLFAYHQAGIQDIDRYDHAHVSFELDGVHLQVACTGCHAGADAATPPAGGRFLGLSQQCASCHDDAHDGTFGVNCASCHEQQPGGWNGADQMTHDRFPLAGAHGEIACTNCHPPESGQAIAAELSSSLPVRNCATCHDNPHGTTAMAIADATDCARCHDTTSFATARPDPLAHALLGFELAGAHAGAACASCHGQPGHATRWPSSTRPTPDDCASCHEHPHAHNLVTTAIDATRSSNDCANCHLGDDASFTDGRITAAQHRATGFSLATPHDDIACSKCHDGPDRRARFPGRQPQDCRTCHRDAHGGQFVQGNQATQCTTCHELHAWQPHRFGINAHAKVFPLAGAHDGVACGLCHDQTKNGIRQFAGTPSRCASCHDDVHDGRFERSGMPEQVHGRQDCARCHDTTAFRPLRTDFDHALWTGHPLHKAHASADCADCHREPTLRMTLGRVPGSRCSDCHTDVHLGQFATGAEPARTTDCRRCHDEGAWRPVRFDHARDSQFQLDATHSKLACSACHQVENARGKPFVRYRPLGTACADCHKLGSGR